MLTSEQLKAVRKIQIRTSHLVSDLFAGQYQSAFKGQGMEFAEVRPYIPGDDIRTIDWNVTARTGIPHVKRYAEERELTVMLVVDSSGSTGFGSVQQHKRDLAAEIAAVLAFSAISNNDKVGLVVFTDQIELSLAPKKGTRHVLRVVREILGHAPKGRGTNLPMALDHLSRVSRRRAVVFLISDFLAPELRRPLRVASRQHDLVALVLDDPRDEAVPPIGLVSLEDPETGEQATVDLSDPAVREEFRRARAAARQEREQLFRSLDLDHVELRTDQPYANALLRYFRRREHRQ